MYNAIFTPDGTIRAVTDKELRLREFLAEYDAALGYAAASLGGQRGAQLVNEVREALAQRGVITHRLRCMLRELHNMLDIGNPDNHGKKHAPFKRLEPEDPTDAKLRLLFAELTDALQVAGILSTEADQPA